MTTARLVLGIAFLAASVSAAPSPVVLQTAHVSYRIGADGTNVAFVDRATGVDYLKRGKPFACAWVRLKGREHHAHSASLADGRLTLGFRDTEVKAVLRVELHDAYLRLVVESVSGSDVESLTFVNVPLTLKGRPGEPFGACAFSLNLITRVDALPALQSELRASAHRKFGLAGAQAAIVGVPMAQMLPALKEVLTDAEEMPPCRVAGPWAQEIPFNHGSYLFNFGSLTEATVDDWIAMTRSLGVTQIDHHGGSGFFRFGDFVLNPAKWPAGWETYHRIVQRLQDAGIGSIFHTYAFFIDKQSRYVTPVPDRRLDAFRSFTLAAAVAPDATEIPVNESTKGLSTVTGFFEHNSVVLHLGDELATFGGVSQEPPWRFTGVKRGAFGTRPGAHAAGATARHLKECFGLFVPDVESSLFEEIARNHADIVNACGFDGIYLDAIDGSSILRGPEECWYWADKFVFEIQRHLKKPVGMEMSAMWHHFWQYRTRWQAWDYPQRGHKRFIDLHAEAVNGGLLLPLHFGWWNFQAFDPPQIEPTYPDVIEYLGAKLIGWDAGISLTGAIDAGRLKTVPLFRRAVETLRTCEELRRGRVFPEAVRARLREPGKDFSLARDTTGAWRMHPALVRPHTVSAAEPWSLTWSVENPLREQPLKLRIEALMSAPPYDDPGNVVLMDLSDAGTPWKAPQSARGVTATIRPDTSPAARKSAAVLSATNSGQVPRNAAWARVQRVFEPRLSLKERQALGVWIDGDGRGEIVALRLESPRHIAFGALADRYVTVDFTGRRFFTLVETESARWSDYVWNDGKWTYNAYRETIDFGAIESVSVWYNDLPPGQEVRCVLGAVKALPMTACTVKNPVVTVSGRAVSFPVELRSGAFLEFNGRDDCTHYGPKGETLAKVSPRMEAVPLRQGTNQLGFSCESANGPAARARVVVIARGDPL